MIKAIIFDMGGVVLKSRTKGVPNVLLSKIKAKRAASLFEKNLKKAYKGKISTDKFFEDLSNLLNVDINSLKKQWGKSFLKKFTLNKELMEIIDSLKEKRYKTALISNTTELNAQLNKKQGFYKRFHPKLLSHEVRMMKPEERIYRLMLKKLKLKPEQCIFTDDKKEHLAPAKRLGMKTILFKNAEQFKKELKRFKVRI